MPETELTVDVNVQGIGDVEGDQRTMSEEAAEKVADIVKADLRERYTDIDDADDIEVVAVQAPFAAIIKINE